MTTPTLTDRSAAPVTGTGTVRVLIADPFRAAGLEAMTAAGCTVQHDSSLSTETLAAAVQDFDPAVLVVRSTRVTSDVLEAGRALSLVIRAGAGYDTIDLETASRRGIFVANCPGRNAIAVAELAWGLILSCDRRIPDQVADLREGRWRKKEYAKAAGLHGRTLGIVGLGRIGREVARLGQAFGMRVVAWSRNLDEPTAEALGIHRCGNLANLARMADVVSIHLSATPDTEGVIDAVFLDGLRPGAILVNTSRASLVDAKALAQAVASKGLRVGIDVHPGEPTAADADFEDPFVRREGVYGTHHVGASTDQAQEAIADEAVRIIRHFVSSDGVLNCVNKAASTIATRLLTVRHLNRPGVLAHVFYTLGQAGINVEEMENIIYEGAHAACARIQLDSPLAPEHLRAIEANDAVLSISMASLPMQTES